MRNLIRLCYKYLDYIHIYSIIHKLESNPCAAYQNARARHGGHITTGAHTVVASRRAVASWYARLSLRLDRSVSE